MDDTSNREQIRDKALQGIGRNVVAFQKMEAMLKFLVANHKIEGLPEQLLELRDQSRREVDRHTMGTLVDKLFRSVVRDGPGGESRSDASDDAASVSFSFELDAEAYEETRYAFRQIVQERNALIHQMLVSFNPNSIDSCKEVLSALDEQRSRLKPHYDNLRAMVRAVSEGQKKLLELVESEEFFEKLTGSNDH